VTFHLSSISSLYVQDGAIGSSAAAEFDVKVRVISDNPSAIMSLSNVLQKVSDRAISHDTCPLTIYVASSIRYFYPFGSSTHDLTCTSIEVTSKKPVAGHNIRLLIYRLFWWLTVPTSGILWVLGYSMLMELQQQT
jgi:hypothetical protein